MISKKDKRGDIPVTIFVIGVTLVCIIALASFNISTTHVRNSFVGLGTLEQMNIQIERNSFYKQTGSVTGTYGDINSMFNYAKENDVYFRRCYCGDNCDAYANMAVRAASNNGIPDPVLLLSLMMQESTCVNQAYSGSSVGLMQINVMHCGKYGLPADKAECMKQLTEDTELNINVGAKILKESYESYKDGRTFQGCSLRNITYYGWDAALRGYNGWGCGVDKQGNVFYDQDTYVEQVMNRYNLLKGISSYVDATGKGGLEVTNSFPFIKRKENVLFSAKFTEPSSSQ